MGQLADMFAGKQISDPNEAQRRVFQGRLDFNRKEGSYDPNAAERNALQGRLDSNRRGFGRG